MHRNHGIRIGVAAALAGILAGQSYARDEDGKALHVPNVAGADIRGLDRFGLIARGIGDMMASVLGDGIRYDDPHRNGKAPYKRHDAGTRSHRRWKRIRSAGIA
jgi:hypothetical protein